MKTKNLLNRMCKRSRARKIAMTDRSLGLVMLVAVAAGATATMLTKRIIIRIILKTSAPKSSKARNNSAPEFHETTCTAQFSENCTDS